MFGPTTATLPPGWRIDAADEQVVEARGDGRIEGAIEVPAAGRSHALGRGQLQARLARTGRRARGRAAAQADKPATERAGGRDARARGRAARDRADAAGRRRSGPATAARTSSARSRSRPTGSRSGPRRRSIPPAGARSAIARSTGSRPCARSAARLRVRRRRAPRRPRAAPRSRTGRRPATPATRASGLNACIRSIASGSRASSVCRSPSAKMIVKLAPIGWPSIRVIERERAVRAAVERDLAVAVVAHADRRLGRLVRRARRAR